MGESAGTQNFDSVMQADVIVVIGANPTDGHPVFASQTEAAASRKARNSSSSIRAASISCARRTSRRRTTCNCGRHQRRADQLARHTIGRDQGLVRDVRRARLRTRAFEKWRRFIAEPPQLARAMASRHGRVPAPTVPAAARLYATGGNGRDLLRSRRDRAQPGLDDGHGHREPRDGDRQRRAGRASA
jgi:formate dehydrogenase major subunit